MSDLDQKYYSHLFERVRVMIQNPRYPADGVLLLHVYKSDTWGKPTGWTVFHLPGAPENVLLNRVQWRSKHDIQRMSQATQPAEPTLVHAQAVLDADAFGELMRVGRKIRVPLFEVKMAGGFDGAYYGMVIPRTETSPIQNELRLQWWEYGALEWQPFTGWAFKMIELFERTF